MTTRNFGPYRLTGNSTRGKTGIAHVAVDTNLDEPVELIELPGLGTTDAKLSAAFLGVMERLASVETESIATPMDYARTLDQGAWYVTSQPAGVSLGEFGERLGRLHWRQACMILHEVAHALSFAHSRGVAHGNLSPSALLFDASGRDAAVPGQSATSQDETRRRRARGTPRGRPALSVRNYRKIQ